MSSNDLTSAVVKAVSFETGAVHFYSGKGGEGWLTKDEAAAFGYTFAGAKGKAEAFRRGIWGATINFYAIPAGWVESTPGGMATRNHPTLGGIIDKAILGSSWFVIFQHEDLPPIDGLASRADAFAAFLEAIERIQQ